MSRPDHAGRDAGRIGTHRTALRAACRTAARTLVERVLLRRLPALLPQTAEELSQRETTFLGQHALDDLDLVIERRRLDHVQHRTARAELGIARPEYDAP